MLLELNQLKYFRVVIDEPSNNNAVCNIFLTGVSVTSTSVLRDKVCYYRKKTFYYASLKHNGPTANCCFDFMGRD